MKKISLSGTPNRHPSATSSTIITLKPTAKNTVPTLECCPCDISGISFSTTTYSMAPAKRSMALRYYKLGETPAYYITAWYKLLSGKWEFGKVHATETTVEGVTVELTTADGSEYGLHHVTNIWRGTELGFNTDASSARPSPRSPTTPPTVCMFCRSAWRCKFAEGCLIQPTYSTKRQGLLIAGDLAVL